MSASVRSQEERSVVTGYSYRLAQRPASYVVLKYVRTVIKHIETQKISCPAAPRSVIEGSRADVSVCAVSGNCPAFPVPRSSPDLVQVRSQRIVAEVLLP